MTEEVTFDPFYNVRVGGPKEKRIRRVELMGEHKPPPVYYIKVIEPIGSSYLGDEVLKEEFEAKIGKVQDLYRPVDSTFTLKEFALVGFLQEKHVRQAILLCEQGDNIIDGREVIIAEAKPWLLELYPKSG